MNSFLYLERELLGAIRARSGVLFSFGLLFLFLFLAMFASLFVIPEQQQDGAPGRVLATLSSRLTTTAINDLSDRLVARSDVVRVKYSLPETTAESRTGGTLELTPRSAADVSTLARAVAAMEGVTNVESVAPEARRGLAIPPELQTGLLVGLCLSALLSLALVREGFRALLGSFRQELRLARLAGTSERRLMEVVGTAGLLWGLLAGLLVVGALFLYEAVTIAGGGSLAVAGPRLFGVAAVSLLLAILMGGLAGLVGASQLSSRQFEPLP